MLTLAGIGTGRGMPQQPERHAGWGFPIGKGNEPCRTRTYDPLLKRQTTIHISNSISVIISAHYGFFKNYSSGNADPMPTYSGKSFLLKFSTAAFLCALDRCEYLEVIEGDLCRSWS